MPRPLLIVAACVVVFVVGESESQADKDKDEPPTISVSGTGKISAKPDIAVISMGVLTHGATAREALASNSEAMTALLDTLKQYGVASKDVQTSQIQVNPQYSQPQPGGPGVPRAGGEFIPRIVGYNVANMVQVTARDISKLGVVLDAVVQAGANQIHGISFRIDHPEKLLDEARKRAMADAKHKAELLAGEAGVVVGPPKSIQESGGEEPPRPLQYGMRAAMAAPAPVPVAAGEEELAVTVHVVYELQRAK
jgi:uncharacterized protein